MDETAEPWTSPGASVRPGAVPTLRPVDPADLRRPRGRRRTAIVIGASLTLLGGAAVWVVGMVQYANHDRIELLDLPEVSDAAAAGCQGVVNALSDPKLSRDDRIEAGNAAIADLTDRMEALGDDTLDDDLPARAWIEDWRTLARAREKFDPAAGGAFAVPQTEDGYPITMRMGDAAATTCATAADLAASP